MFTDRGDAGRQLARSLGSYAGTDTVVLALPRGGVVLGREVADALSLPLDIVAIRKIPHPGSPEYAIGAVDEYGTTILNPADVGSVESTWLKSETRRQQEEAKRRSTVYRAGRDPEAIAGKTALLVDDGIATGLTMRLALRAIKAQKPKNIIVAVPVAPPESLASLKSDGADEVIVLEPPDSFLGAVGAHYRHFDQVEDDEVIRLMRSAK